MRNLVAPYALLLLVGCGRPEPLKCIVHPGGTVSKQSELARSYEGAIAAKILREHVDLATVGTGLGAGFLSQFGGTDAYAIARISHTLRRRVAEARAIDGQTNLIEGAKIEAVDAKMCEVFADSLASLEIGQSRAQMIENIGIVEGYFERRYELLGGKKGDIKLPEMI